MLITYICKLSLEKKSLIYSYFTLCISKSKKVSIIIIRVTSNNTNSFVCLKNIVIQNNKILLICVNLVILVSGMQEAESKNKNIRTYSIYILKFIINKLLTGFFIINCNFYINNYKYLYLLIIFAFLAIFKFHLN